MSLLLLVCVAGAPLVAGSVKTYGGDMDFECPASQMMSHAKSLHSDLYENRRWEFGCRDLPFEATVSNCEWTRSANDYDRPMWFGCPDEGFIAGIRSEHNRFAEDRRFNFKFKCCEPDGYGFPRFCDSTQYDNDNDGEMDYTVPQGQVMRGWTALHNNEHKDLQFKFDICAYRKKA